MKIDGYEWWEVNNFKVVSVYFKVVCWNFPGGNKEDYKAAERIADSAAMVWTLVKWIATKLNLQSCHVRLSCIKIRTLLQKTKTFTIMAICFWHYDITPVCHWNIPNIVSKDSFSTRVMKLLSGENPILSCFTMNAKTVFKGKLKILS